MRSGRGWRNTLLSSSDFDSEESPIVLFPDGIKVLYDGPDAAVDVCFIHGLNGDRENTWTADRQSAPWPEMLLPSELQDARILVYGYDAHVVRKGIAASTRLVDHAANLLSDLTSDRARCGASSRPLVFVAHSLGGLVCKKAILLSRNNPEPHLRSIFDHTNAVVDPLLGYGCNSPSSRNRRIVHPLLASRFARCFSRRVDPDFSSCSYFSWYLSRSGSTSSSIGFQSASQYGWCNAS